MKTYSKRPGRKPGSFKGNQIIQISGLSDLLKRFEKRLFIANRSQSTIRNYVRAIRDLSLFNGMLPAEMEIDQVIDYLLHLKEGKTLSWRKIKIDTAGIRCYFREMEQDEDMACMVPYPKEEKTLPKILSREELLLLFNSCQNPKHRVMFRLLYSSGLRRMELLRLRIEDIDTKDGKRRIRINKGKGGKDRYTVLSNKVLDELRRYYTTARPKTYLFNGHRKGYPMSKEALRHALNAAVKRSGLKKKVNPHILRHCFASHALEDGMNIRTLQYLLGHSSIRTTLIYLHVSDIPLQKAFSPLDNIKE